MRHTLRQMLTALLVGSWCVAAEFAPPPPVPMPSLADKQFGFAEDLRKSGDGQLAILEYRRFIFMFSSDPRVPDARLAVARGHLEYTGDVGAARRELAILAERHPDTQAAERAQQLDALIESNKEMDYKPLLLFFGALSARERGDSAAALARLDQITRSFPQAQLAPEAFLMRGQVLESERRLDDAIAAYAEVPARYPTSPAVPRALLGQATATEARDGGKPHVVQLYQQIAQRYPNTPYAAHAQERYTVIQRGTDRIDRQFGDADVVQYRILQSGYLADASLFEVQIEIPQDANEKQVKATLEDALIKQASQRKVPTHAVRVTARFPQSRKKAGTVAWTRDQRPNYDIERIKSKDKVRGFLDDLRR